jgi:predicted glycoside hydrolase/deacetylase ChbG (UPF0249 family)
MIIINSDDFGASPSINKAIVLAFEQGLISSTTVMVNKEPGLQDAADYVRKGHIDPNALGIHLNLTDGVPLSERMRKNPKFCENGIFRRNTSSFANFTLDKSTRHCIIEELEAQLNHFIKTFNFIPSHIDSHQHIHNQWAIAQCIMGLAKKYNIRSIRLSRNTGKDPGLPRRIYKSILNWNIRQNRFIVTDYFGSISDLGVSGINNHKHYEIMVHALLSSEEETIVDQDGEVLHDKLLGLLGKGPWELVNYHQFRDNILSF